MAEDPVAEISADLGVPVERLGALRQFDEKELRSLAGIVHRAFERHDTAVNDGMLQAVRFVPPSLRPHAARLLFPEDG